MLLNPPRYKCIHVHTTNVNHQSNLPGMTRGLCCHHRSVSPSDYLFRCGVLEGVFEVCARGNGHTSPRETVAGCADEKRCAQSLSFKLHHPPPRHLGLVHVGVHGVLDDVLMPSDDVMLSWSVCILSWLPGLELFHAKCKTL